MHRPHDRRVAVLTRSPDTPIGPSSPLNARRNARGGVGGRVGGRARGEALGVAALLAVAGVLNLYGLANEGYANRYYAAAVRSMLLSWHNFFFASFDPGGFVSVDKPPLGFWIQTFCARIFGFHGWSLLLPQALAGTASVGLLYALVRRHWGILAGVVAALALVATPVSVVTNRNNTIDSLLVLSSLAAAWALTRAIESGSHPLRWLLLCGVLVGVGFNIKMLEAYLVVPALWLAYLVAARPRPRARVAHLLLASAVTLAVSLSWATVVDLTPAAARPYVGSSRTNSVLELALGYNGLERLAGTAPWRNGTADITVGALLGGTLGAGGMSENGAKGPLRLLNTSLGGQIGWLIPLAVVGLLAAAWTLRPRRGRCRGRGASRAGAGPLRRRRASLVIWGTWFLTMATFFSVAGFFHRYYTTMLAPGVAALAGLGVAVLWRAWRRGERAGLLGWVLPATLVDTAVIQGRILANYPGWQVWLAPTIAGLAIAAAVLLAAIRLLRGVTTGPRARVTPPARIALTLGLAALLLAPAVWSGLAIRGAADGMAASLPLAGPPVVRVTPEVPRPAGMPAPAQGTAALIGPVDSRLLRWLIANRGGATYLVAVSSASQAESVILQTGLPVMATGGFSGSDPILTTDRLAALVAGGALRYFIVGGMGRGGRDGASLDAWVATHGTPVPSSAWGGYGSGVALYDLLGAGQ